MSRTVSPLLLLVLATVIAGCSGGGSDDDGSVTLVSSGYAITASVAAAAVGGAEGDWVLQAIPDDGGPRIDAVFSGTSVSLTVPAGHNYAFAVVVNDGTQAGNLLGLLAEGDIWVFGIRGNDHVIIDLGELAIDQESQVATTATSLLASGSVEAVESLQTAPGALGDADGDTFPDAFDYLPGYSLVVAAADFTSPEGRVFAATPAVTVGLDPISTDVVVREHGGRVYVVNRFGGDNIQVLDPAAGLATTAQFSTGNGSNPHDVAVVGDRAYITRNQEAELWIVDPGDGTLLDTVDLSPLGDNDGLPEMDQMAVVGTELFVTLQHLDEGAFFIPSGPGAVAVIDTVTDQVTTSFALQGGDPVSRLESDGTFLYVATNGDFGVDDGGVERIDPADPTGSVTVVSGGDLGGDLGELAIVSPTKGYVVVSAFDFATGASSSRVVAFNPTTGAVLGDVFANDAFLPDIRISPDGTLLAIADRTASDPGVRLFDTATDQAVAGPLSDSSALPPSSFVFVE